MERVDRMEIGRGSLTQGLSLFLIGGEAAGTLFCYVMDGSMKAELCVLEQSVIFAPAIWRADFMELFVRVLEKRLPELLFVFLLEMTAAAPVLLSLTGAWIGFSTAVMICALTMESGLLGIVRYLVLMFPQCLFYAPVIYILFFWMPEQRVKLKPAPAIALIFVTAAGAAAEAFLNPWLVAAWL